MAEVVTNNAGGIGLHTAQRANEGCFVVGSGGSGGRGRALRCLMVGRRLVDKGGLPRSEQGFARRQRADVTANEGEKAVALEVANENEGEVCCVSHTLTRQGENAIGVYVVEIG